MKWEEDRTSTPTDAESDSEFGASEGTGIGGVDGNKDGKLSTSMCRCLL